MECQILLQFRSELKQKVLCGDKTCRSILGVIYRLSLGKLYVTYIGGNTDRKIGL